VPGYLAVCSPQRLASLIRSPNASCRDLDLTLCHSSLSRQFSSTEQSHILRIMAGILHLGNLDFVKGLAGDDTSQVGRRCWQ
jgi:uncharacterized protein YaeQ